MTLLGQLCMTRFSVNSPYLQLALVLVVLGIGNGLFNSPNRQRRDGERSGQPPGRGGRNTGAHDEHRADSVHRHRHGDPLHRDVVSAPVRALTGAVGTNQALDALTFMEGMHRVYLFGSATAVVAILCSLMRGTEDEQRHALVATDGSESGLIGEVGM